MIGADADGLDFKGNPPAREADLRTFELQSGIKLPTDYEQFMRKMNGGEGFVGNGYVIIYPIEKLLEYNSGYRFEEYVPGLFLFGTNGGGEAFAFDRRNEDWSIVMVPFIPLELREAVTIAPRFATFFEAMLDRYPPDPD